MSLEAIKAISEAEEKSQKARQDAVQASKRAVSEVEAAGREGVKQAAARANEELAALKARVVEKAREEALALSQTTENRKAAMLVRSESRRERAVNLVVERIVKS